MTEGSTLIKLWRRSFLRRAYKAAGAAGVWAAAGSRILALIAGDRPGWFAGSRFCLLVNGGVEFLTVMVDRTRKCLTAAVRGSRAVALLKRGNPGITGFVLSFAAGLGLTLLVGGVATGRPWWPAPVLLLLGLGLVSRFWPRCREIWTYSLTGRLWAALTVMED